METPLDLSGYLQSSLGDLVQLIDNGTISARSRRHLTQFTTLLSDRVLMLLRTASRSQIIEESASFSSVFSHPLFENIRSEAPHVAGAWETLSDLLHEAGRKSDSAAIDSILTSYAGMPRQILEMLAGRNGEELSRSEVRQRLGISESYLSHILREMDEAGLVQRDRTKRKDVVIRLGAAGRDVIQRRIYPAWIDYVIEAIARIHDQRALLDAAKLESDLVERGMSSPLAAKRLADALRGNQTAAALKGAIEFKREEEEIAPNLAENAAWLASKGLPPVALFSR